MIMLSTDNFTSSCPSQTPFLSFSPLTALARASRMMSNRNDRSGHLCLAPELRGEAPAFSGLSLMGACG